MVKATEDLVSNGLRIEGVDDESFSHVLGERSMCRLYVTLSARGHYRSTAAVLSVLRSARMSP